MLCDGGSERGVWWAAVPPAALAEAAAALLEGRGGCTISEGGGGEEGGRLGLPETKDWPTTSKLAATLEGRGPTLRPNEVPDGGSTCVHPIKMLPESNQKPQTNQNRFET